MKGREGKGREGRGRPPSDTVCLSVQKNGGGGSTWKSFDLNVEPVWKMGYNGNGVVVSILDDGEWVGGP